jgi:putative membrane protein
MNMKNQLNIKSLFRQTTFLAITTFGLLLFTQSMVANAQGTQRERNSNRDMDTTAMNRANKDRDTNFIKEAVKTNMEDVKLGQLAQQQGQSSQVIELGREMQQYHQNSIKELTALAKTKNVTIPTESYSSSSSTKTGDRTGDKTGDKTGYKTAEMNYDVYNKLKEKSGEDFDKAFAKLMVSRHEEAITTFEKVSSESNDPEIKAWADESLTDLRSHLAQSKKIHKMHDTNK